MMIRQTLDGVVIDVVSIYLQGTTKPISLYIDWRMKKNKEEFNPDMHAYVVSHVPCYHSIDDDVTSDPKWKFPSYVNDIYDRILTLVSLA